MSDAFADDLPSELTRLLRNVGGVHTVYATRPFVPTLVSAVVEAVKHEPVGMHLVSVTDGEGGSEIVVSIGVTGDEPAGMVCRRAYDEITGYFSDRDLPAPASVAVQIGRVG